jgi:integrase/recombinase XerC
MTRLSDTTTEYLNYCYPLAERTKFIYREHLIRLTTYLDDPPLNEITEKRLVEFMAGLRRLDGLPYSANYQSQIWRTLHTFFQFCHQHAYLPCNLMTGVPRPHPDNGPRPRLKIRQVQQLIQAVRQTTLHRRNLAMILLMVGSGLRLNEIIGLEVHDLDFDAKSVWVTSTKTHKSREVPIRQEAIDVIKAYLGDRQSGPLFLSRYGDPITREVVWLLMRRLRQKLKFPVHAHLLRHTFGHLYNRKGDLRKLQKIMGHSDVTTTARFYTDPDFEDIQAEYEEVSPLAQLEQLNKKEQ